MFCRRRLYCSLHSLINVHNTRIFHKIQGNNMGVPLNSIIQKLQDWAPLNLAENWDNVGLLVAPNDDYLISSVLLTIDLTEDVVDEAVKVGANLVISYHPNIFKPLKSVTQKTWKEKIIINCIKNNITVFSPHTTWDAINGGVNDWLGSAFNSVTTKPILVNEKNPATGMGRFLTLKEPIPLKYAIKQVKELVGIPHIRLGLGRAKSLDSSVSSVALCAGSGASVLNGIEADLYLTGEMLHHDVLDATQKGISVILCNHSDSERGFLKHFKNKIQDEQLQVFVSEVDKDCLTVV